MERAWQCLKTIWMIYTRVMITLSIIFWVAVWTVGSYQAGQFLGPNDLIPTADKWIGKR
jgi:hypothetical protein